MPFLPLESSDLIEVSLETTQCVDWGLLAVHAPDCWKETRGEGIRVAVLDTGPTDHPDVSPNVTLREGDPDDAGHGTHVAGIVGAVDNGVGVVGVAPGCSLLLYRVLPGDGTGIAAAITRAGAAGADVVNLSLGSGNDWPELRAACDGAAAAGVVVVAAAGNDPSRVCFPAAYPSVIAVSALDQSLSKATFAPLTPNHVALPGVSILSTWLGGQYARLSGTSQASPLLAGIVALMLSLYKPTRDVVHETVAAQLTRIDEAHGDFFYTPNLSRL